MAFTPYDRRWVSWEARIPAARAAAQVFDRAAAFVAWRGLVARREWKSSFAPGGRVMSRDEAVFWFFGLSTASDDDMRGLDITRSLSAADVIARVRHGFEHDRERVSALLIPLANLFDGAELLEIVLSTELPSPTPEFAGGTVRANLAAGFCDHVAPFLSSDEFAACRARLRQKFAREAWATESAAHVHLAAALHLPELVAEFAGRIPAGGRSGDILHDAHHVLYGLGGRERIVAAMARTRLRLRSAQDVREWFALTGNDGLAYAFAHVADDELNAAECVEALGVMRCAATAAAMLGVTARPNLSAAAKGWLDRHPELAIPAALASVGQSGLADAAVDTLKRAAARGHAGTIEAAATRDVREFLLGAAADAADDLGWLDAPSPREAEPIPWLQAARLPALIVDGRELGERHVAPIVRALRAGTLHAPDARIRALRRHARSATAERFALALFDQWKSADAPVHEPWALHALGLFGADAAAAALGLFIRAHRGERAAIALDCLRAIGSDAAVMFIEALSRRLPSATLRAHATGCLDEIAAQRNLTRDELEDRTVPVRAVAGIDVVRLLCRRLEAAMVEQRRWRGDAFAALLVAHELAGPLVRRLLWMVEPVDGGAPVPFRVLADGTTAGADDEPVPVPARASVRLAHRVELDERALDAWEARFAASHVVPPFAQTGRIAYRLDDVELADYRIRRFDRSPVREAVLLRGLRARGWFRDERGYSLHARSVKRFERSGLTAMLHDDVISVRRPGPEAAVAFDGCTFVRSSDGEPVRLRDVPAVAISEVCADCAFVLLTADRMY